MEADKIRSIFLDFFRNKQHEIVASAPMVVKNDPTLMFTNAGMNQFKDFFLGNAQPKSKRIANTQKCLRVSGKHNDLEEVGHDTYHHTMFEMLGNWSFGDYFKKEAIAWAWELLTEVYQIDKELLYVTVFEGDAEDGLPADQEALSYWKAIIPEDRILPGSKKDNFWEMGDTGPCGPCSEIHVDIRDAADRKKIPGASLVNQNHPLVLEIWNLVFIEFNRQTDGALKPLPARHVDTGMGFERLSMVLQGKKSNYDTDIFQPFISVLAAITGKEYGKDTQTDIAMRVAADHVRAISFAIADGQLPSNNKAGYVIRRILRRAVRYGYTFLGLREPFLYKLADVMAEQMGVAFPEVIAQKGLISKVIHEEEASFIRTLSQGITKFEHYLALPNNKKVIAGAFAFELFDTYGFPVDLTRLMAAEKQWTLDMEGFMACMEQQKDRSRQAAAVDHTDWIELMPGEETVFVGYDHTECEARIVKYRKVTTRNKELYQIVLNRTPFYAESGGQAGDKGFLESGAQKIGIEDTRKENDLTLHIASELPADPALPVKAVLDTRKRALTAMNHTATHLLHAALRSVLGTHVEQKGSYVDEDRLRFDFAHYQAMSGEEIQAVETLVLEKIWANIPVSAKRDIPFEEAKKEGALALFGEKYGDRVRIVSVDGQFSKEFCGGTHVENTGKIGLFLITGEAAIAAGVRRVEAITGLKAMAFIRESYIGPAEKIKQSLKKTFAELPDAVDLLVTQHTQMRRQIEGLNREKALGMVDTLSAHIRNINGMQVIAERVDMDAASAKDLAYALNNATDNLFLVLAYVHDEKPGITLMLSEKLVKERGMQASKLIRELAKEINGGGGGQEFFATAGGKKPEGIQAALDKALEIAEGAGK